MTDQPNDIDVEAERVAFSIARDGVHYCDCMLEGWLARARIAAEREREILDLLREAADFVHLECLGKYGKAGHTDLCRKITEALAKREERTNDANG